MTLPCSCRARNCGAARRADVAAAYAEVERTDAARAAIARCMAQVNEQLIRKAEEEDAWSAADEMRLKVAKAELTTHSETYNGYVRSLEQCWARVQATTAPALERAFQVA